ncbi:beta family protein [Sinomonas sp. P47F7]|uniref:beta family protein n=1 Tax=Sinomonas sp. P47F7 TaxID=3410987 RepID=UPI003BF57C28
MAAPLSTFSSDTYVPILKAKQAELDALQTAPPERLVPLLEVAKMEATADMLSKAWPHADDVVWVHCVNLQGETEYDFAGRIFSLFQALASRTKAVPVVTETETQEVLEAVRQVIARDSRGVVLRLDVEDIVDPDADTSGNIAATLDALGVVEAHVDLLVDCGLLREEAPAILAAVAARALSSLPNLGMWRNVAVAFSAFPQVVGDVVAKDSVGVLPRYDAAAFVALQSDAEREVIYSDYAVGLPSYGNAPFAPIPNIKYATDREWRVHRAHSKTGPSPQYRALANPDLPRQGWMIGA